MTEKSEKVNESQIDFLKHCPFCGSTDVHLVNASSDSNEWGVVCRDCDVWTDNRLMDMTKEQAIELWNRRVC